MSLVRSKNLFLCRTPLQARICLEIIKHLKINSFDVIYFTQNDNESDKYYFSQLLLKSNCSLYLYVKPQRKDILNHLLSIYRLRRKWSFYKYDNIYLASIDSFLFRYLIKRNPSATLSSFDDGTANITPSSLYFNLEKNKRTNLYSNLLKLPSAGKTKLKISKHYSIYPGFENILEKNKTVYLSLFNKKLNSFEVDNNKIMSFFIGQPFHEYLSTVEIQSLKKWLENQSINFYIMHPREKYPLVENIPLLDKKGLLAEDAIFDKAGSNRPRIISAYSTVLFNVDCQDADKVYLSLGDSAVEMQRKELIRQTGSKIINIL